MAKSINWRNSATNIALYLRVSSKRQYNDACGLESQEKACRTLSAQRGWNIVAVFKDPGISAWADKNRPGLKNAIAFLREHADCNLLFFDYSRVFRHTRRALDAFELLDSMGVIST